jgi:hypothetical protein
VPLGQPCLVGACAKIYDGDLQLCFPMFNSENFQFLEHVSDDESAGNFQPSSSSNFCESACDFSTGNHVFSAGNCMGQQDIECRFYDSHFQPSNSVQNFISRSEISSHTSSSCLVEDILLLEQPTSSLLEGVIDVFHADLPLERHIFDVFRLMMGCHVPFPDHISALFNIGLS